MAELDIDLLIVASSANQFYLTEYDGWSFYTPQAVVVGMDIDQALRIGRAMDAVGAKFTAFMDPEYIIPYPDVYVSSRDLHPMQFLVDIIKKRDWAENKLGSRWMTIIIILRAGKKF